MLSTTGKRLGDLWPAAGTLASSLRPPNEGYYVSGIRTAARTQNMQQHASGNPGTRCRT